MQNASLTLSPKQLTTLIGPNGSGKTTLLRLLAGLWQPTVGKVTLNGRELPQFRRYELAQQIALVPQNTHVNFAFRVKDIIMMGRHPHRGRFQHKTEYDLHCVEQAMTKTDVVHLANRSVTELSGGERQRVMIARSLASQAQILLLDEPTASLDIAHALEILNLLTELVSEGKTVAFSIHDLNLAKHCANQIVLVHQGQIVDLGSPDEVLTDEVINKTFGVQVERIATAAGKEILFFKKD